MIAQSYYVLSSNDCAIRFKSKHCPNESVRCGDGSAFEINEGDKRPDTRQREDDLLFA